MPKTNAQKQADFKRRKKDQGLIRKEIFIYPETWSQIQAYCERKTNKARLLRVEE